METKLFFALYVFPYTYFYCVILIQYCLFKWFLFIIHQLALTLLLVIYMYCLVLITSTGSFPLSGLIVYMVSDVTRGAGPQFLHRAREIPFLVDFATLRAQCFLIMR